MSAYAAALTPANSPLVPLGLIPLVALVAALVLALFGSRLGPRRNMSLGLGAGALTLGLVLVHGVHLFTLDPARRALRDVSTNLIRIGSFDANLGFFLDPKSALFLLVTLGGIAFISFRTKFVPKNDTAVGYMSRVLLLAAGVSAALLADGFVALLFGLSLATVAMILFVVQGEVLSSPVHVATRIFGLHFAGMASLLAAFVLLFWALGGRWTDPDGYLADYRARFVSVHTRDRMPGTEVVITPDDVRRGERDASVVASVAKQRGTLTFTSHPGARVYIDVGEKILDRAEPFAVSPFVRKDITTGPHDVIIVPGGGAIVTGDGHEVAWIERLVVGANEDVSIVALGQSTTFAEIADQLALVDDEGKHFLRNALFNKKVIGSLGVVPTVVFLLALASLLFGAVVLAVPWLAQASPSSPAWNVNRIAAVALGLYPLVRLDELTSLHLDVIGVVFVVGLVLVALVRARRPSLLLGAATMFAALAFASPRYADAADAAPRIVVRAEQGAAVELGYAPDGETMFGAFVIRNDGPGTLLVSRAAVRGGLPFVSVDVEGVKGEAFEVEPGTERRAVVRWRFGSARARELFGHVFVESNGEGSRLVAIHAQRPRDLGLFGDYALSHVIWLPLVAALLALGLRAVRRDNPRWLGWSSGLVYAGNLAFVVFVSARFDRLFGRADGNDGYQFIERWVLSPSLGVEYFLGLDGLSLTLIVVTSIAALIAAIASVSLRDRAVWFHVFASALVTSAMGVFLSLDLLMFCVFWLVGMAAAIMLVAYRAPRPAAIRFGALSIAGAVFLGVSAYWLHTHSDPTYAVDGRYWVNAMSIQDLGRVTWVSVEATLFGTAAIKVLWSALFIAFALRLVFLADVFAESDTPTNVLLPAAMVGTGIYGLLRLNLGVLPAGTKWAATTMIVVGVMVLIVFSLLAMVESDLKRVVARISTAYSGFALVGLGSLTPQGISASVYVAVTLGLVVGLLSLLVNALQERVRIRDARQFGGLSKDMPIFALMFGLAMAALIGLPGLVGFWGLLLSVVGAFVRQRGLAAVALVFAIVLAAVQIRLAGRMLFGAVPASWHKSKYLEPFGGKFPELYQNELMAIVPLVVMIIGLGLAPRTLFSLLDVVILDLHRLVDAAGIGQVG